MGKIQTEVPGFSCHRGFAPHVLVRYVRSGTKSAYGDFPAPEGATDYYLGGNFLDFMDGPTKGSFPLNGRKFVAAEV